MGIEVSPEYGGSGSSFFMSVLAIEELSKVDPSIGLVCDLQNTICNTVIQKFASKEQQQKYLPRLTSDSVFKYSDAFHMDL